MDAGIRDALATSNRVTTYLLEAISADALGGVSASKGRSVGAMFAHLHNTRLMWLEAAAKDLRAGLVKIEKERTGEPELLRECLDASARAVDELVRRAIEGGRIVGFRGPPAVFVGYLIAHDGYHWGEIGIALTQSGYPLDRKVGYGMWEWGVR